MHYNSGKLMEMDRNGTLGPPKIMELKWLRGFFVSEIMAGAASALGAEATWSLKKICHFSSCSCSVWKINSFF